MIFRKPHTLDNRHNMSFTKLLIWYRKKNYKSYSIFINELTYPHLQCAVQLSTSCKALRLLGEPVAVVGLYELLAVPQHGVPVRRGVVHRGQLAAVVLGQVGGRDVLVKRRHLRAVEEDLELKEGFVNQNERFHSCSTYHGHNIWCMTWKRNTHNQFWNTKYLLYS